MHIHLGLLSFFQFLLYLVLAGGLLRALEIWTRGTKFSEALAFIY